MRVFKLIPYTLAVALLFYLLPMLITGLEFAAILVLVVMPILTFLFAACHGKFLGFSSLLPLVTALVFAPTILMFYNSSAWILVIVYAIIAFAGNLFGRLFYKFA